MNHQMMIMQSKIIFFSFFLLYLIYLLYPSIIINNFEVELFIFLFFKKTFYRRINFDPELNIDCECLLDNTAAHHKMSIKPKKCKLSIQQKEINKKFLKSLNEKK